MSLITPDQVAEHHPLIAGWEPAALTRLIDRADALMASHCGWPRSSVGFTMTEQTYTWYLSPRCDDSRLLDLPHPVISALTTVHIDPRWSTFGTAYGVDTLIAAGDLLLDPLMRELYLAPTAGPFLSVARANRIVAVAGFAEGETPPDLVAACATAVRHLIDFRRVQGQSSVSAAGESANLIDGDSLLPESVRAALTPYVVWASRVG